MKTERGAWINFATLIVVNLLWAAQYPAYKIAGNGMESATLNFWTLLFAAIMLIPLWLRERRKRTDVAKPLGWTTLREYLLLGIFGIVTSSVMLLWGITHSSASNAAILSLTIPVLMTGLGVLMLGEKLSVIRLFSLLLGLVGTLLVSTSDLSHVSFSRTLLLGNFVILIGGLGSAFYNTYSKDLLSRYWLAVAFLGFLSWGIAMILWMWVLNRLEVGQISTSIYLLPLFGLILSIVTVHDHITLPQILGGTLTVAGTATLTLFEGRLASQATESG
jgi:drug/metabolite transporter (DMT)-like permease